MTAQNQHQEPFDLAKAREHAEWTAALGASGMDGISAENINYDYLAALDEIERLEEQLHTTEQARDSADAAYRELVDRVAATEEQYEVQSEKLASVEEALAEAEEQYEDAQAIIRQRDAQIQELTRDGGGDSIHLRIASEARERMHAAEDEVASLKEQLEVAQQERDRAMDAAEGALAAGDTAVVGWTTSGDAATELRAGLEELLSVAERIRGGDSRLNPEEWYAARDYARATLARYPASEPEAL